MKKLTDFIRGVRTSVVDFRNRLKFAPDIMEDMETRIEELEKEVEAKTDEFSHEVHRIDGELTDKCDDSEVDSKISSAIENLSVSVSPY